MDMIFSRDKIRLEAISAPYVVQSEYSRAVEMSLGTLHSLSFLGDFKRNLRCTRKTRYFVSKMDLIVN